MAIDLNEPTDEEKDTTTDEEGNPIELPTEEELNEQVNLESEVIEEGQEEGGEDSSTTPDPYTSENEPTEEDLLSVQRFQNSLSAVDKRLI